MAEAALFGGAAALADAARLSAEENALTDENIMLKKRSADAAKSLADAEYRYEELSE